MISNEPKRSVPHREPFLLIHRLVERNAEGTEGIVEYDVKSELDVFRGHFPGRPIFPGVLQMEAAAQACLWVNEGVLPEGQSPPEVLFAGVDSYRFKKPVVPPCTLRLHVERKKVRGAIMLWDVTVSVGDDVVSKGSFWVQKTLTKS